MKSLFPEMDREEQENRSARHREAAQRIREEKRRCVAYLRKRDLKWLIDYLVDHGPNTEHNLILSAPDLPNIIDYGNQTLEILYDVYCLWRIGKFWRVSQGIHPGSGEEMFLYGIRKVHPIPNRP